MTVAPTVTYPDRYAETGPGKGRRDETAGLKGRYVQQNRIQQSIAENQPNKVLVIFPKKDKFRVLASPLVHCSVPNLSSFHLPSNASLTNKSSTYNMSYHSQRRDFSLAGPAAIQYLLSFHALTPDTTVVDFESSSCTSCAPSA